MSSNSIGFKQLNLLHICENRQLSTALKHQYKHGAVKEKNTVEKMTAKGLNSPYSNIKRLYS